MAKKQKKECIQIITLLVLVLIFSISAIFTKPISKMINTALNSGNIYTADDGLLVHYINVGQGDAMAINFPNGEIMLIDAGPKERQNNLIKYVKSNVLIDNDLMIDYMILTHSDVDHCGGVSAIFAEFEVVNFYRPDIASTSEDADNYAIKTDIIEYDCAIKLAKAESDISIMVVNQEFEFDIAGVKVQIFPPVNIYNTTNDMSSVIKLTYYNKSFLFTGDIGDDSEQDMMNKYGDMLNCDVLKVAHHGSKNSTSQDFIDIATPKYAIICVGDNYYGHPNFNTVSRLEQAGAQVISTKNGDVRVLLGQNGLTVLDKDIIYSTMHIHWWSIVLTIDLILIILLMMVIVKIILQQKEQNIG